MGQDSSQTGQADYYLAQVSSASLYYPFGWEMPGRKFVSGEEYRFGFNGQEEDPDMGVVFKYRIHDARVGRFLSVDPLAPDYPWNSCYAFAENRVIDGIDLEGREWSEIKRDFASIGNAATKFAKETAEGLKEAVKDPLGTVSRVWDGNMQTIKDAGTIYGTAAEIFSNQFFGTNYEIDRKRFEESAQRVGKDLVIEGVTAGASKLGVSGLSKVGRAAKSIRKANWIDEVVVTAKQVIPCGCFTGSTLIKTEKGYKYISEIAVGDYVWAFNDSSRVENLKQVTALANYQRDSLLHIYIAGEQIETTTDHPFYSNSVWVRAGNLSPGDSLYLYGHNQKAIDSIVVEEGSFEVYNFTVEGFHTYYVSDLEVLVHNSGPCPFTFTKSGSGKNLIRTTKLNNGKSVQIKSGHGYNRSHRSGDVRDTGLTMDEVESGILMDLESKINNGSVSLPRKGEKGFNGAINLSVEINGNKIGYRAIEKEDGQISIGTYYLE